MRIQPLTACPVRRLPFRISGRSCQLADFASRYKCVAALLSFCVCRRRQNVEYAGEDVEMEAPLNKVLLSNIRRSCAANEDTITSTVANPRRWSKSPRQLTMLF